MIALMEVIEDYSKHMKGIFKVLFLTSLLDKRQCSTTLKREVRKVVCYFLWSGLKNSLTYLYDLINKIKKKTKLLLI